VRCVTVTNWAVKRAVRDRYRCEWVEVDGVDALRLERVDWRSLRVPAVWVEVYMGRINQFCVAEALSKKKKRGEVDTYLQSRSCFIQCEGDKRESDNSVSWSIMWSPIPWTSCLYLHGAIFLMPVMFAGQPRAHRQQLQQH
jgi:hypothetical protein